MKIKKFRASTPSEAMRAVRRELGEDAVILSTRQATEAGAPAGERVEMIAAVDWEDCALDERLEPKAAPEVDRDALDGVQSQLEELRRVVHQLSNQVPVPDELALSQVFRTVYAEMIANEVDRALALRVVRSVKTKLEASNDPQGLAGEVQSTIKNLLPEPSRVKRRFQVLVGPTGVGKTTTAAKLAARELMSGSGPVLLATSDTYRVAAVDQLRCYARAMGARFKVVRNVGELDSLMSRYGEWGHVILDTEGRGQRDLKSLEPWFGYLSARDDVERHLVLSATTKPRDLDETIHRFRGASPERLIFTKVDETNSYGPILSESVKTGLAVSYLGTGQKVPEELLVATPQKLAELAVSALA